MKMLIVGDIAPTIVTAPLFEKKDIKTLFGDTVTLFEKADVVFGNLECAITDCDKGILKFGPSIKAPLQTAEVLKSVGFDCCGLSNNHAFDFGIQGILDTKKALDDAGIVYTGFGDNYEDSRKNLVIDKNGEKICIITVCEHEYSYALENRMGSRVYDEYDTMEDIRNARKESDRVIVIYHGGKEECAYPSPRLRKLCRAMVKNGADVVVCQHSHCIGCYEEFEGGHILYGEGNFHFVKPKDAFGWDTAFAMYYDTVKHEVEFVPVQMKENGIELSKGENKNQIIKVFEKRNAELKTDEWKKGWHDFCVSQQDYYFKVISRSLREDSKDEETAMFGHFLDCEAHTDVWRELFPSYNLTNETGE